MIVQLRYGVTFGKCDSSDWIDWEIELTDEEAAIYEHAVANQIPLNEVPELQDALRRAYEEIEEEEISMGIDNGDEYVLECQGEAEMDPYEYKENVNYDISKSCKNVILEHDSKIDEYKSFRAYVKAYKVYALRC